MNYKVNDPIFEPFYKGFEPEYSIFGLSSLWITIGNESFLNHFTRVLYQNIQLLTKFTMNYKANDPIFEPFYSGFELNYSIFDSSLPWITIGNEPFLNHFTRVLY